MNGPAPLMALRGVGKSFPGVRALDGVDLEVFAGEVHVILGQNGAGKSTLIRILGGACRPDEGHVEADGRRVAFASPAMAARMGVAVIHQELTAVPHLDLARNIFLGREAAFRNRLGLLDLGAMRAAARRALDAVGLRADVRTEAAALDVAGQQLLEIAKALSQDSRVLVMDEPTASLSVPEAERLFAIIRRLRGEGHGIVYISHRMPEVKALGDRITVMRDGRRVALLRRGEAGADALVAMMVGRAVALSRPPAQTPGAVLLEAEGLSAPGIADASIRLRAGEVVGLAGLVGSGRTELLRALFGAERGAGAVRLGGRPLPADPVRAAAAGLGLVPEDRKRQGLALGRPVRDNLLSASFRRLARRGVAWPARLEREARSLVSRLSIRTAGTGVRVGTLSGGNQQKCVFGRWLSAEARILLLDEPTRGVDVAAKAEIHATIRARAGSGCAVLLVSSELPELIHLCDRAYVLRDGRIVGELAGAALTEAAVLRLAVAQEAQAHAHG
ncbi:sugar ABC transporter ATP-binding protein [Roseomonas sp. NAR14]|uniref:Sugar ABC transporter ATP-binding protein n=1 Tax=Roseomonas acroporae TaxID=2937791 RepID=A0A9X1YCA2_9PROT|nr:sugar ABC transporter ATP-binding protein [Roseomonas acroporae]MCK8786077.1 sugar ABC transporter ATP-binding protein [Roseomonas acroporae]